MAGAQAEGDTSYIINHNAKQQQYNGTGNFQSLRNQQTRIAFITSGGTASASELLINSLAPHTMLL